MRLFTSYVLSRRRFVYLLVLLFCLVPFRGKGAQEGGIRFAFLTDLHVDSGSKNEQALVAVVKEINSSDFDFVVVSGDLTNRGSDAELHTVKAILDKLVVPCYVIPGNHETNWSESACQTFTNLWGNDRFVFERDSFLFVGFSTGPYMKMGDGHVKAEDLHWIEKTLEEKKQDYKHVISINHYPLRDEDLGNSFEVTDILKRHHAVVSFCGHGHALRLFNFDSIPGIMGRSLFVRSKEEAGYNVVSLKNDSLSVFEKELGREVGNPFISMRIGDRSLLKGVECTARPVLSKDTLKKVDIVCVRNEDASVFTGLAFHENCVFYGTSLGELIAYDFLKGKTLWRKKISKGSVYSTPVVSNGVVIVGSIENRIVACDASSGELVWKIDTPAPVVNTGTVFNGNLYMGAGNYDFLKIDIPTGKLVWKYSKVQGFFQAPPVVKQGKVVFGAWDRHLYCLDAQTGKECWQWTNPKPGILYSPGNCVPAIANGKVFFVSPDRYMTALGLDSGKELWRNNAYKVRESMGISSDGDLVFAKTMDGELLAVSSREDVFKDVWCLDTHIGYEHNPCPTVEKNGVVYLGSRKGVLVAVDAHSKKILWSYKCGNSSINQIVFPKEGSEVWVSLMEGKIYRFTLIAGVPREI